MRSHVPVTESLTAPLFGSTAYIGGFPPSSSQIALTVTHPPRVVPSPDSRYSRADDEEYRIDTVVFASQSGFAIGLFGDGVSTAWACLLDARRPVSYTHLTLPTIYSV